MSETEIMGSIPLGAFKAFEATEGGTCLTRGKVVMQAFRAARVSADKVRVEIQDGDSHVGLTMDRAEVKKLAEVLVAAAG